jgi:hypothetical protein
MSSVIAERQFEVRSNAGADVVVAQIMLPQADQDVWRCSYRIAWPARDREFHAMGADSWQALHLAAQMVAVDIFTSEDFKAGRVSEFGRQILTYEDLTEWLGIRPTKVLQQ